MPVGPRKGKPAGAVGTCPEPPKPRVFLNSCPIFIVCLQDYGLQWEGTGGREWFGGVSSFGGFDDTQAAPEVRCSWKRLRLCEGSVDGGDLSCQPHAGPGPPERALLSPEAVMDTEFAGSRSAPASCPPHRASSYLPPPAILGLVDYLSTPELGARKPQNFQMPPRFSLYTPGTHTVSYLLLGLVSLVQGPISHPDGL